MTDPLDVEKPLTKKEKREAEGKKRGPGRPRKRVIIPVLPDRSIDVAELPTPDQRASAAVNLKLAGASFQEIADELGYASASSAQTAYVSALANMNPVSSWEVLRQEAALRAEARLRRSLAMADATHFVDANDPDILIPNTDQLRWHEQSGKDLALLVTITGAKAPARVELSADTQELTAMVNALLLAQDQQPELEASVFDPTLVPAVEDEGIVDAEIVEESPMGR